MINYLTINILILIIPLLLTFEKNLKFYRNLKYYLLSVLVVGIPFITWDYFATLNGDWAFNPEYLTGIYFFNLPIEEILFFITVPYSILFIYETINFYIKDKVYSYSVVNKRINELIIIILVLLTIYFHERNYTATVLCFVAFFFLFERIRNGRVLKSRNFYLTMIISYLPFFVINYLLTSLPIVTYNDNENLGVRITTIPVDDFLYSFAMISLWIFFYDLFKNKILINKN